MLEIILSLNSMQLNKKYINLVLLILLCTSCVKIYQPPIKDKDAVKFVVYGQVNKGDKVQRVTVSTSSPISEPRLFPVKGCIAKIIDGKGNIYLTKEVKDGTYETTIPESELVSGSSFKVDILVPDGTNIVSDFDQLHEGAPINNFYCLVDTLPTLNPRLITRGLQFYTDFDAGSIQTRNFRWEITETWQYRASYPIEWWWDGTLHREQPVDNSRRICWKTADVNNVFTLSTKNLSSNKFFKFQLHFVDNISTPKLMYGYSVLIRQYSQSESANDYWEKLRINSVEQGGLYNRQPMAIRGNLHNITNPDQHVLGFFGAASVSSKRIFINKNEVILCEYIPGCSLEGEEPRRSGLKGIPVTFYPAYLYATQNGYALIILDRYCYDCLTKGGDTIKPFFWPK